MLATIMVFSILSFVFTFFSFCALALIHSRLVEISENTKMPSLGDFHVHDKPGNDPRGR